MRKRFNILWVGLFFSSLLQAEGWLGIHVEELSKAMKIALEVKCGVLVSEVLEDSPAEKAGLKIGDVILQIDDKEVEDFFSLSEYVSENPDKQVELKIKRKGKKEKITVTLGEKEKKSFYGVEPFPLFPSDEMYRRLFKELNELKRNLKKLLKEKGKTYEKLKEGEFLLKKKNKTLLLIESGEI
jgi:membrane-associated protease RseP (regulator of RpoE activity)